MALSKKTLYLIFGLLIGIIAFLIYDRCTRPKMAIIEIQKVYDAFDLKKELEAKFKMTQNQRKKILDSLEIELKYLYASIEKQEKKDEEAIKNFNLRKSYYMQKKQMNQEDDAALSKQYDSEILTQLNQYVKDYGKENGYTYVFGTDGNGSMMYAKESADVSNEVIIYINNKYKGIK
jgi:outer membrane protein